MSRKRPRAAAIPPRTAGSVSARRDVDDACAGVPREPLGPVVTAVVGDDDLPDDAEPLHGPERLADAGLQGLGLVEAREHDTQLDWWARPVAAVAGHVGIDHVGVPLMQQVRQGSARAYVIGPRPVRATMCRARPPAAPHRPRSSEPGSSVAACRRDVTCRREARAARGQPARSMVRAVSAK